MGNIYITDAARAKLDILVIEDKRPISDEIDYLLDLRLKELNIPAESSPSSEADKPTPNNGDCQEQNK